MSQVRREAHMPSTIVPKQTVFTGRNNLFYVREGPRKNEIKNKRVK